MSGPRQVHKVEQSIQTYDQPCDIPLRQPAKQHVQEPIESGISTTTTAEIPLKVPENGIT